MATKRKPRQPSNESKADKFSRLASKRVTKALKAIANIGNLSGGGYERTNEQVKKITDALTAAVNAVKARFEGQVKKDETFSV